MLFEDATETEDSKDTIEDDPIMEGGSLVKTITFNPNYVVGE